MTIYNTDAMQGTNGETHRGDRVDSLAVKDTPVDCGRAESLIVWHDTNNQSEVGWYEGPTGMNCSYSGTLPRRLIVVYVNHTQYCFHPGPAPPLLSLGLHAFQQQDANGNGYYAFDVDHSYVGSLQTTWTQGVILVNGEAHCTCDSAYGDFDGTSYLTTGGWLTWNNAHCKQDNNPGYNLDLTRDIEPMVTQSGATTC
jgi:hypothetical protein